MKHKALWFCLVMTVIAVMVYYGDPIERLDYWANKDRVAAEQKREITTAQQYLNSFGYQLKVNGIWDEATQAAAAKYVNEAHPDNSGSYQYYIISDMLGLRNVQYKLQEKGYELEADGFYDEKTKAAITAYQKEWELPVTGRNDADFYNHITTHKPAGSNDYARSGAEIALPDYDKGSTETKYYDDTNNWYDYSEEEYYNHTSPDASEDDIHHVDPHYVDDYYREDGTHVDGYWRGGEDGYERSDPDGFDWNNLN